MHPVQSLAGPTVVQARGQAASHPTTTTATYPTTTVEAPGVTVATKLVDAASATVATQPVEAFCVRPAIPSIHPVEPSGAIAAVQPVRDPSTLSVSPPTCQTTASQGATGVTETMHGQVSGLVEQIVSSNKPYFAVFLTCAVHSQGSGLRHIVKTSGMYWHSWGGNRYISLNF